MMRLVYHFGKNKRILSSYIIYHFDKNKYYRILSVEDYARKSFKILIVLKTPTTYDRLTLVEKNHTSPVNDRAALLFAIRILIADSQMDVITSYRQQACLTRAMRDALWFTIAPLELNAIKSQ